MIGLIFIVGLALSVVGTVGGIAIARWRDGVADVFVIFGLIVMAFAVVLAVLQ